MQPIAVKITKHSGKPREWRIWWDVGWIVWSASSTIACALAHNYVMALVNTVGLIIWVWLLHFDLKKFEWTATEEEYTLTGKEEKNEDS